jgi:hypothetical protein
MTADLLNINHRPTARMAAVQCDAIQAASVSVQKLTPAVMANLCIKRAASADQITAVISGGGAS